MARDNLQAIDEADETVEEGEQTILETDDQLVPADVLTQEELRGLKSSRDFFGLLRKQNFDFKNLKNAIAYEQELRLLQVELIKLQRWVQEHERRVAICGGTSGRGTRRSCESSASETPPREGVLARHDRSSRHRPGHDPLLPGHHVRPPVSVHRVG